MLKISRRAMMTGGALSAMAAAETANASAASGQLLAARQEMAVQVVDFGWRRDAKMFDTAGPGGAVTNEIYTLETAAHHVRFRFQNGLAGSWTISGASYAPTASAQSNPVDAAGRPADLLPVTFGNNGQDVALADQGAATSAATSLTLPPAQAGRMFAKDGYTFRGQPQVVFSDWMPIETVGRADGQPGCLVMLRVRTPSAEFTGIRPIRLGGNELFQGTAARPWRSLFVPQNDATATALTDNAFGDPQPLQDFLANGLCCGIQAIGDTPGLTLASIGDSALMGGGERQGYLGPIKRAADLMSSAQLPVSHVEAAIYGCPSSAFRIAGRLAVETNKISCAFMQVLSGNDPHTMQAAQASVQGAYDLAAFCRQRGTLPVLVSPGPFRGARASPNKAIIDGWVMDQLRQTQATYPFLDVYQALGQGGVDDAEVMMKPGLMADDAVHLNSAGNTLLAQAAVALLQGFSVTTGSSATAGP